MQHDVDGIGARDLCDEREEAVPERERVAGMETAVGELVRALEREVAEREELLDAREVEEPVAADLPCDAPEEDARARRRRASDEPPAADAVHSRPAADRERQRDEARREHEDERERQRGGDDEGHAHRAEQQEQRPRDRGRDASHATARATTKPGASTTAKPNASCSEPARCALTTPDARGSVPRDARGSRPLRGQTPRHSTRHPASSASTSPEPSQRRDARGTSAPARRGGCGPRTTSDARSMRRARSASPGRPWSER